MSEKRFTDVAKTPKMELECKKKYLYEYSMFWECNDGSKCQILEEDVCEKLNEQQATISRLEEENEQLRQTNEALNSDYIKLYKFIRRCNLSEKEKRALWELLDE